MPKPTLHQLTTRREQLINFLKIKVDIEDWIGITNIILELREIDAKLSMVD